MAYNLPYFTNLDQFKRTHSKKKIVLQEWAKSDSIINSNLLRLINLNSRLIRSSYAYYESKGISQIYYRMLPVISSYNPSKHLEPISSLTQ